MHYSKRLRNDLLSETNHRCYYCGVKIDKMWIEHIIPRSKGGSTTRINLVVNCERCNRMKNNLDIEAFRSKIENKLNKKNIVFFFEKWGIVKEEKTTKYTNTLIGRRY